MSPGVGLLGGILAAVAVLAAVAIGRPGGGPESLSQVRRALARRPLAARRLRPFGAPAPVGQSNRLTHACFDPRIPGSASSYEGRWAPLGLRVLLGTPHAHLASHHSPQNTSPPHPVARLQVADRFEGDGLAVIAQRIQKSL
jgi:hypothetical protein